jgi:hypothetical protein
MTAMVSELASLDIIRFMHGRKGIMTRNLSEDASVEFDEIWEVEHASADNELFRGLLPSHDLHTLEQSVRWLTVSGYLTKAEWGLMGPWVHLLTDKARRVAVEGKFPPEDRALLYQDDPHGVFIAQQFNPDDHELVKYLKEEVLGKAGFNCYDGKSEGLEPFRTAILSKIQKARYFLHVV